MKASTWRVIVRLLVTVALALLGRKASPPGRRQTQRKPGKWSRSNPRPRAEGGGAIEGLFRRRESDAIVTASGTIVKLLRDDLDDTDGSGQHQQFLVEVDGADVTVKISHNLDFGRVPVREGDAVRFRGEYEYNDRGGCVHWTHHDPKGWHEDGWIEHRGRRYS
jgi:hypothetical protein